MLINSVGMTFLTCAGVFVILDTCLFTCFVCCFAVAYLAWLHCYLIRGVVFYRFCGRLRLRLFIMLRWLVLFLVFTYMFVFA